MKKTTLTILSLILVSGLASAQVYFRAGGGYAFPIATQSIGEMRTQSRNYDANNYTSIVTSDKSENVSASYGAGINFNVAGGYMISDYIGVDLNVSYLMGKKYETGYDLKYYSNGSPVGFDTETITTKSKALFITPSFVLTSGGVNAPYARFGVVLGSPSIEEEDSYVYEGDGSGSALRKGKYKGGVSTGFQGAVGMNWKLSDNLKIYTEVNFTSMTYYPKEYNLTEASNNGVSYLGQLTVSQKEIEFVKKVDNLVPQDSNKPNQELREGIAFSSVSLQVGIVYSLAGKSM